MTWDFNPVVFCLENGSRWQIGDSRVLWVPVRLQIWILKFMGFVKTIKGFVAVEFPECVDRRHEINPIFGTSSNAIAITPVIVPGWSFISFPTLA